MAISSADVKKIAHLARLSITEEEVSTYLRELTNILSLVDRMQLVDTQGLEPMAHPLNMTQRLRPDVVTEVDNRSQFQAIAPAVQDGLYLVPKVID